VTTGNSSPGDQDSPNESHRHVPGSLRELLAVAVPLVISAGSVTLMYVVDRIFLTWHSSEALAAAMPASMVHWSLLSLPFGMAMYTNTFVSQYDGAGRPDRIVASLWQAIYVSLIAGVLLALCTPLAGPIFAWANHGAAVEKLEVAYLEVLCLGSLPFLLSGTLSGFFTGRGRTKVVMWVNVAASLLNIGLDYLLIFGNGPIPALGVTGAAIATVSAQCTAVFLYASVLLRPETVKRFRLLAHRRFDPELFVRFIKFGLPNGAMFLVDVAGFTVFLLLLGQLGPTELAATNLAFNINSMAFVPMLGVGTAVMILVGRRVGEGRPALAVRTTWIAFGLASIYMICFSTLYLAVPELFLLPYAALANAEEFAEVQEMVIMLLRYVAVYAFFDAMIIVFSSAVRGAGDTRFGLWLTLVAAWMVMVVPTWVAIRTDRLTLHVGWLACTGFIVTLGIGFLFRFLGGRWQSMSVLEPDLVANTHPPEPDPDPPL
jgi:MATE family multidrug resistance protein